MVFAPSGSYGASLPCQVSSWLQMQLRYMSFNWSTYERQHYIRSGFALYLNLSFFLFFNPWSRSSVPLRPASPVHSCKSLRSAHKLLPAVPKSKRKLTVDRSFSTAAPNIWNNLPLHIRQTLYCFMVRLSGFFLFFLLQLCFRVSFCFNVLLHSSCTAQCFNYGCVKVLYKYSWYGKSGVFLT